MDEITVIVQTPPPLVVQIANQQGPAGPKGNDGEPGPAGTIDGGASIDGGYF